MTTGISYERLIPGVVPEFEERDAARFSAYSWDRWVALPHDERVMAVAYYRLANLVDRHAQDAVERWRKRREAVARVRAKGA